MKYLIYYYHFINNLIINIYTDGSSKGNPGPGGIGIIIKFPNNYKKYSYKFRYSTNNRMELYAIFFSLKKIKKILKEKYLIFNLYSDSKYIINIINKKHKIKKNFDIWKKIFFLKIKKINFFWIKGHNKNYYNEKCNKLAYNVINNKKKKKYIDFNYENKYNK
ncbi:MAG: ribonuclease HI [Candidatus Shikimatogenerans sp. JK-2022]|nr:ribonuclease HI [Candidatus Shikimatogenerans bostrichidophilus]